MKPALYFDNAATTATRPEVVDAMLPFMTKRYGNPSSLHALGREAQKTVKQAREQIANLIGATTPEDIIFTSGGTESNNTALKGIAYGLQQQGRHIITSNIEHSATLEPCQWLESQGWDITYLGVDREGFIRSGELEEAIRPDTALVSLIHGNNEVGTVQHLDPLSQLMSNRNALFHIDAVQTIGKIPFNLNNLAIDLLSCSAHKLYGPKGIGFLYATQRARNILTPWIQGGGQQAGLRSGTENVAAIAGLAKALELMVYEQGNNIKRVRELQEKLISGIQTLVPTAQLNGPIDLLQRVPGNINFSFAPIEGEALVLRFDLEGICVSSGSACHSGQLNASYVLQALGCTEEESKSSVRFSIGLNNTAEEVDLVLAALPRILEKTGYFRTHGMTVQ